MPFTIAACIARGFCTLKEVDEYYGFEDILNMLEINQVDNLNKESYYKRRMNG
jgi:hypothetical protein